MKVKCDCCGVEFKKSPSAIKKSKSGKHFCSKSCAAKINNILAPKRSKEGVCSVCHISIPAALKYCEECSPNKKYKTLGDVIVSHLKKYDHKTANIYNGIRSRARSVAYFHKPRICERCGYNKHTQVSHKKPISDFSMDANIDNEINHINNLLVLCPNCHWEHDHGLW